MSREIHKYLPKSCGVDVKFEFNKYLQLHRKVTFGLQMRKELEKHIFFHPVLTGSTVISSAR